jgi:hypothetical protein
MAGDQLADAAHERSRRGLISTSWFLVCSSLRAVNSARISCAGRDLQCTGRNQLSRICWAMPRTSLRSVLTGIALPAKTSALRSSLAVPAPRCPSTPLHRVLRRDDPQQERQHGLTGPRACLRRAAQIGDLADIEPIARRRLYRSAAGYGRQAALTRDPHAVRLARREELIDR